MTITIDEKFALLQDMKVIDNNRKIVERLKKQIEELAEGCYLKTELKKIIGEEND